MEAVQKRHLSFQTRANIAGYLFISPFILGFLIWFMIPAAVAIWLIFQDWNLISTPRFIGLKNIIRLAKDPLFLKSLQVTVYYTLISVPLGMIIGFLVALLMNSKVKAISFFRTVFYLPSIVPAVANAMLWSFIFNSEYGLLNAILRMIGFNKILWLQDPKVAVPALILMSLWGIGGGMVIYLAGLQGIPVALYEAAEIDGADRLSQLWYVTIPLMSPIIFFNLIMGIIGSFQVFSAGYLITNGGPQNATLFYVLYNYKTAFQYLDMGYASVLAWVLFLIILILTMVVFKYVGKMVYYEDVGN
jgi:multiple sugar transport system permease protein